MKITTNEADALFVEAFRSLPQYQTSTFELLLGDDPRIAQSYVQGQLIQNSFLLGGPIGSSGVPPITKTICAWAIRLYLANDPDSKPDDAKRTFLAYVDQRDKSGLDTDLLDHLCLHDLITGHIAGQVIKIARSYGEASTKMGAVHIMWYALYVHLILSTDNENPSQ